MTPTDPSLALEWRCLQAARAKAQTSSARYMRAVRARQAALDPNRNWRAEEYQATKFHRATQPEGTMTAVELLSWLLLVAIAIRFSVTSTWDKSVAPPPGLTRGESPPPPRRAPLTLDTSGNQPPLEAAPHRGRLVAWGGSIWRSR